MRDVEASNSIDKPQFKPDIRMPLIKSTEPENGSISYQKHLDSKLPRNSKQVPSELITSCVATLLMIRVWPEGRESIPNFWSRIGAIHRPAY
ncbi:hypothetical protein V6N13_137057 [Hibiscus sabdariffa]